MKNIIKYTLYDVEPIYNIFEEHIIYNLREAVVLYDKIEPIFFAYANNIDYYLKIMHNVGWLLSSNSIGKPRRYVILLKEEPGIFDQFMTSGRVPDIVGKMLIRSRNLESILK